VLHVLVLVGSKPRPAQLGTHGRSHRCAGACPLTVVQVPAHAGDVTSAGAAAPLGKVSYTKNGVWQGPAHPVPLPQSKEERYYPHILLRNCQVGMP